MGSGMLSKWVKLNNYLFNLDNMGGFSVGKDIAMGEGAYKVVAHFPASTCEVYWGTKEECQSVLDNLAHRVNSGHVMTGEDK